MFEEDLVEYSDEDILHDYMLMAEDFTQDDTDVAEYRAELERRGYTFITEECEYDPEELEEWTWYGHPSLTVGERNRSLTKRKW